MSLQYTSYTTLQILGNGPDQVELIRYKGKEMVLKVCDPDHFCLRNPAELLPAAFELHPGLVKLESILCRKPGSLNKGLGLCTRFEGPTLRDWIREGRGRTLSLEAKLELIWRLWSVVAELHQAGVIHLDLKPANVVMGNGVCPESRKGEGTLGSVQLDAPSARGPPVGRDATVPPFASLTPGLASPRASLSGISPRLIDFGHARHLPPGITSFSSESNYMTTTYAPPEVLGQAEGPLKIYGTHSDTWSLAAVAFFILTGGTNLVPAGEELSFHARHLATPAKCKAYLIRKIPEIPTTLLPVLVKMLSPTPVNRPSLSQARAAAFPDFASSNLSVPPPFRWKQPHRLYHLPPEVLPQLVPYLKMVISFYCQFRAEGQARAAFLACDIFYRSAYLTCYPQEEERTKLGWRCLALIAIYLAEAGKDLLHPSTIKTIAKFVGAEGVSRRHLAYLADAVVAQALTGIVAPAHLFDSLSSREQLSRAVCTHLLQPQVYIATPAYTKVTTPYPGTVDSLKIFWRGF